jgi:hypothetical protein
MPCHARESRDIQVRELFSTTVISTGDIYHQYQSKELRVYSLYQS